MGIDLGDAGGTILGAIGAAYADSARRHFRPIASEPALNKLPE
ncbi:MAG: hypothetical protein ACR2IK_02930 [Chloroflexota bacterium]